MQFPIRSQLSGKRGLVPVYARRLIPLLLIIVVEAYATKVAETESVTDTVGSELLTRVDVQQDSMGELGDASIDVDAPEQLNMNMPPQPKAKALTAAELALVQDKVSHKTLKVKKVVAKKNLRKRKENPAVVLAKVWDQASKDEIKSETNDADVDQLGAQLNNIMGDLTEGAAEKESSTGKQVLEQATAMEDAADSDDPSMKEATAAAKGGEQKDDAENVVDGAMAYIRTRLASEEHKSLRLRQLLQQSVRGNQNMKLKVDQLRKQVAQGAGLQKNLRDLTSKKFTQEEGEITKQKTRADTATKQLVNATRAAKIGERAMKFLGMRLKYAKSQVAALLLNLANSSQQNTNLKRHLVATNATEVKEAKQLVVARKTEAAQAKELAEVKAKLAKLQQDKSEEDVKMTTLDRQKDLLQQRESSSQKRDKILHKENNLLKKQLAAEIQREEQLREMWSKESEAFTWQLRAERANASESLSDLEKARMEFKDLRDRVAKLRERATHGEQSRHQAEDAANRAQFALAEAEAENKQLKGSVPWLEAEIDRQRQSAQNASTEAQKAEKERDTVKAILGEAQKNIVQLQGQYADALQALVVAQAGGADTSRSQSQAPSTIQQFAGINQEQELLGAPPPVESPIGLPQLPGAGGSSLLELGRDSKALNNIMNRRVKQPVGRVDLQAESGGLNALMNGMRFQQR